jgi:ABC-type glycerol-3-phosphate transport system substrate-binding protein
MKKILICLLLCTLCSLVVWAGGEKETPGAARTESAVKTPIELYKTGFTFPSERITFSFWTMMGTRANFKKWLEQVVKDYEAIHPNVAIDVRYIPNQKRHMLDVAAYQANNPGDLHAEHIRMALAYDMVKPAPDWALRYMQENWVERAVTYSAIDGVVYCTPLGNEWGPVGANFLFCNLDHFERAGIKEPPKTLPELIDIAKKTTVREGGEVKVPGYHMRFEGAKHFVGEKFLPFIDAFIDGTKGFLFTEDYSDVRIDEQGFIDALDLYQKMAVDWKLTNPKLPINRNTFVLGGNVMINESPLIIPAIEAQNPNLRYTLAPLVNGAPPYGNDPVGQSKNQMDHIVWKDSKNFDIVWDFNLFLRHEQNDVTYAQNMPSFPVMKKFQDAPFLKEFKWYPVAKIMNDQRPFNQVLYKDPWNMSEMVQGLLGEAVHDVCFNASADPARVMRQKAAAAREKLKAQKEAVKKK